MPWQQSRDMSEFMIFTGKDYELTKVYEKATWVRAFDETKARQLQTFSKNNPLELNLNFDRRSVYLELQV